MIPRANSEANARWREISEMNPFDRDLVSTNLREKKFGHTICWNRYSKKESWKPAKARRSSAENASGWDFGTISRSRLTFNSVQARLASQPPRRNGIVWN